MADLFHHMQHDASSQKRGSSGYCCLASASSCQMILRLVEED
jgi:hypothetical protein